MKYILAILLPLSLWGMNGFDQIGYGAQSKGMGGVAVALPQESLVIATNPAGLTPLCSRFDVGFDWINQSGHTRVEEERFGSSTNMVFPELGVALHLGCNLTAGLAFYRKGVLDVDYGEAIPELGTTTLSAKCDQYVIAPALAYELNPCHSIGIAFNIGYSRFRADGLQENIPLSIHPTDVTNRGTESEWGFGVTVGWLGQYMRCLTVGVAYETPTWTSKFARYRGLLPDAGNFDTPSTFWVGAAYLCSPCLVVAADLGWHYWHGRATFGNAADTGKLFGAEGGPGFGWHNQFVFRLGVAYDFFPCWTARFGYNFGEEVVGANQLRANIPKLPMERHHITFGLTYAWECSEFTMAYIHGFESSRRKDPFELSSQQDQLSFSWGRIF